MIRALPVSPVRILSHNAMWRNRPQIGAGEVSAPPATSLGSAARTITDDLRARAASGRTGERKRRRKPDAEWLPTLPEATAALASLAVQP
jgi:hypothetical protein